MSKGYKRPELSVRCLNDDVEKMKLNYAGVSLYMFTGNLCNETDSSILVKCKNMPEEFTLRYRIEVNFGCDFELNLEEVEDEVYNVKWGNWLNDELIQFRVSKYSRNCDFYMLFVEIYVQEIPDCSVTFCVIHSYDEERPYNLIAGFLSELGVKE